MTPPTPNTSYTIELPSDPFLPTQLLRKEQNSAQWPTTPGFRGFWGWCEQRCERIRGKEVLTGESTYEPIRHLMYILDELIGIVATVPAQPQSNQRFGNLAFRTYYTVITERLPSLLTSQPLPPHLAEQTLPLLIQSTAFGHPTRLDYGTGHELAFMLVLWCCVVSGYIRQGVKEEEVTDVEDELILRVFARYLDLVTLLQQTYRLEPAGSHGSWGLDDYCFFPYLFGSAQLLHSTFTPSHSLSLALSPSTSPSTPTSSLTDLYTLSLRRLVSFKHGAPFSEHSPILHGLSQMPDWTKAHYGLRKWFMGEVVGKHVVVQGLWIGGWCWGVSPPGVSPPGSGTAVDGRAGEGRGAEDREGEENDGRGNQLREGQNGAGAESRYQQSGWGRNVDGKGNGVIAPSPSPSPTAHAHTPAPWKSTSTAMAAATHDSRASVLEATRASWASPTPTRAPAPARQ